MHGQGMAYVLWNKTRRGTRRTGQHHGVSQMPLIIDIPFTVFSDREEANRIAKACNADEKTEYRVTDRPDGKFTIAMYEDGEFAMCL
jgi:hypothetical protein